MCSINILVEWGIKHTPELNFFFCVEHLQKLPIQNTTVSVLYILWMQKPKAIFYVHISKYQLCPKKQRSGYGTGWIQIIEPIAKNYPLENDNFDAAFQGIAGLCVFLWRVWPPGPGWPAVYAAGRGTGWWWSGGRSRCQPRYPLHPTPCQGEREGRV